MKTPSFEIIAGTYEEFLLGYYFIAKKSELVQSIAAHDHGGSIRSIAISGQYLATGSTDDRIIVYDLKSRKEQCMLTYHNATINSLQFTDNHSHLVSGSSDGVLAIARVGNWQLEKIWERAHKGASILDIAVHPSGKLALTLGSDCSLRTWNLVKGRQAYVVNLNSKSKDAKSLDKIIWAEDGIRFILLGGKYTEVWSIESGGMLKVIEHDGKVSSCIWLSNNTILVGCENGEITTVNVNDGSKNIKKAHDGRVKALAEYGSWIVSASSSGEIKVWSKELKEIAKQNSGCRITCIKVVPSINVKEELKEEMLEEVEEQTMKNCVGKSSVVMEVEGSDDESIIYTSSKVKHEHKNIVGVKYVVEESEIPRKKKQKSENTTEKPDIAKIKKKKKNKSQKLEKREEINDEVTVSIDEAKGVNKKRKKIREHVNDSEVINEDRDHFRKRNARPIC